LELGNGAWAQKTSDVATGQCYWRTDGRTDRQTTADS